MSRTIEMIRKQSGIPARVARRVGVPVRVPSNWLSQAAALEALRRVKGLQTDIEEIIAGSAEPVRTRSRKSKVR